MIEYLKEKWEAYKNLTTWKKVVFFIPVIVLGILYIVIIFMRPKSDNEKYMDAIKDNKDQVDKEIEKNKKQQEELNDLDENIKKKQNEIKKRIEEADEKAKELNSSIDNAVSNNDAVELERIRAKLNAESRCRKSKN